MMRQESLITRCSYCNGVFWLAMARTVGEFHLYDAPDDEPEPPSSWRDAPAIVEPSESEYYEALASGLAKGAEEERQLRILAWWRSNDQYRDSEHTTPHELPERRKNLRLLSDLLRDADGSESAIMRGEVLRELGEFSEARSVLSRVSDQSFEWVIVQLHRLCEQQDRQVRILQRPQSLPLGDATKPKDDAEGMPTLVRPQDQRPQTAGQPKEDGSFKESSQNVRGFYQRVRLYIQRQRDRLFLALERREERRLKRLKARAERKAVRRAKWALLIRKSKGRAGLVASVIALGALGYIYWADQDWVQQRADAYYADHYFQVLGYQGYSLGLTGRCYRYTIETYGVGRGLYESCLEKRWGQLQEHDLHRL